MDYYGQAESELKARVAAKAAENIRRIDEFGQKSPEFASVTEELDRTGLELVKAGMAGLRTDSGPIAAHLAELEAKRLALLAEGGLSDIADGGYYCPVCKDRGYVSTEKGERRCGCFVRIYSDILSKNDSSWDHSVRFKDFRTDFYPEEARMDVFLKHCVRFAEEFPSAENKNMLFTGNAGLGKTYMASILTNEIIEKGIPAMYLKASEMFYGVSQMGDRELRDRICSVPFLVIDDLGREKQSDTRFADLLDILDSREALHRAKGLATVISTNLGPREIMSFYDERISSRLLGDYDVIRFSGKDLRLT